MKQRRLSDLFPAVSELCLNTEQLGGMRDESSAYALLDLYCDRGGSFLQSFGGSAGAYAETSWATESETVVGNWLRDRATLRESLLLAGRYRLEACLADASTNFAGCVRESVEASLRRLRTGHLDLLILDWDEQLPPVHEVFQGLDALVQAGLVRQVVAGSFPAWRLVDTLHRTSRECAARFKAMQADYSLLTQPADAAEMFALSREHDLGFLARAPLAGGLLARRPVSMRELFNLDVSWQNERFGSRHGDRLLTALADTAHRRRATPAAVAVAWVLGNPRVSSVLVSASSTKELAELIGATEFSLSPRERRELEGAVALPNEWSGLRHA